MHSWRTSPIPPHQYGANPVMMPKAHRYLKIIVLRLEAVERRPAHAGWFRRERRSRPRCYRPTCRAGA
jgi:hypothetical protein